MESLVNLKQELKCYRISDNRHPIFSGDGASIYPGRWNLEGFSVIYTCETYSGALLEKLAQTGTRTIPKNQSFIEITIPQGSFALEFDPSDILDWKKSGYGHTQKFGTEWLEKKNSLVLIVPSVVIGKERNILINPYHKDFLKITFTPPESVVWDERLFR